MFRKKVVQLTLVDDPQVNANPRPKKEPVDFKEIVTVTIAGGALGAITWKTVDTLSKIAIIAAESKFK